MTFGFDKLEPLLVMLSLGIILFLFSSEATENWKIQTLPLARIKKIMKSEEFIMQELEKERQQKAIDEGQEVADQGMPPLKFMISGEAPLLMSKACELLIKDLSFRAWRHTERNRRRTLQRQDLHAAVGESEVYDFLIDIVPRVTTAKASVPSPVDGTPAMTPPLPPGMPMGGIPTALSHVAPPMSAGPPVGQLVPGSLDNNMMQQMQHQTGHQQQHTQQVMMQHQYLDPQQAPHYQYMGITQASNSEMNQNANQMSVNPGWSTQGVVTDSGSTSQPS